MNKKKKGIKKRYVIFGVLGILIILAVIFMHFGGFSTGKNINPEEVKKYAQKIEDIRIPENAKIIALGEATHGNVEFQQLKLDVFKQLVEQYGIKAFALEGDYGGCEKVNRYIQGGEGIQEEVVKFIDFNIYKTEQIAELISYMREYNKKVDEEQKIRFYGFDMQRYIYNFELLKEECKKLGISTIDLDKLINNNTWNDSYDNKTRMEIMKKIKNELETKNASPKAIHLTDIILQYLELNNSHKDENASFLRDKFMAENVKWILEQEKKLGYDKIFITGHNDHIAKYSSMETMGNLLSKELKNNYYSIGTGFYKTKVNLPFHAKNKRTLQTFYSHDPIAKTLKLAGIDICWINFSAISQNTELYQLIKNYNYMGSIGESYSLLMRILPPSYRIFQQPAVLYDSMIYVTNATPTKIEVK